MVEFIAANWDDIVKIGVMGVGIFAIVARFTPNESDNRVVDWLLRAINQAGMNGGPNARNG